MAIATSPVSFVGYFWLKCPSLVQDFPGHESLRYLRPEVVLVGWVFSALCWRQPSKGVLESIPIKYKFRELLGSFLSIHESVIKSDL